MPENMNSGKTHAFFTWASEHATVPDIDYVMDDSEMVDQVDQLDDARIKAVVKGDRKPDYIVKADDDSFIMLGELERRLRVAPRSMAYWGCKLNTSLVGGKTDRQTLSRTHSWLVKLMVYRWILSTLSPTLPVSSRSLVARRTSWYPDG